jgi:hypothetical protein
MKMNEVSYRDGSEWKASKTDKLCKACEAEFAVIYSRVGLGTLKSHKNWKSLEPQFHVIWNMAHDMDDTCPKETWETFLELLKKFNEQYAN